MRTDLLDVVVGRIDQLRIDGGARKGPGGSGYDPPLYRK
jgi:hypothetical protein